ncbi:MAG TPA: hypothetical protein VGG20_04040, partial [Thermoanaerobaculia bacterium]
ALSACKKKDETPPPAPAPAPEVSTAPVTTDTTPTAAAFKVDSVDLGKAIDADKKITDAATTFSPKDSIYASVASEGTAPTVKLHAKWTFGDAGQVVKEEDAVIHPTGPANTMFLLTKKTPWPVGKYHVEISADGVSSGVKDFEVKK